MRKAVKTFFQFLLLVGVIGVVLKLLVFEVASVGGYSMVPNLLRGDFVLVNTRATLDVGDVAVCPDPTDDTRLVVLRVLAKEGATIEFRRNIAIVDGVALEHETSEPITYVNRSTEESFEYQVRVSPEESGGKTYEVALGQPGRKKRVKGGAFRKRVVEGGLFLVGDNRNMAYDSRRFGPVAPETCLGKVVFVLWASEDSGDLSASDRRFRWRF